MIVVQLTGGIGNQMFQYAAGRALAERRRTQLVLDSSWFLGRGGAAAGVVRRYELEGFALDARLLPVERVARLPAHSRLGTRLQRLLPLGRRPLVREFVEPKFGRLFPAVLDAPDNTYLRGYWQTSLYFEDAEPLLRREFAFRDPLNEQSAEIAGTIRHRSPAVSVHVRRGDYVSDPGARERLGALGIDYYKRAVDTITSHVGQVWLFVFSDDPEWCSTRLDLGHDTTVVDANAEASPSADMHLMSLCDHHVLANSSFSWWGAWLNAKPGKIVIAPKPWLLDARWDDEHRIPREWIRIDRDGHQADQPPSTTTFAPVT